MELRLKSSFNDFVAAADSNENLRPAFRSFVDATAVWQKQTGYQYYWVWPKLDESLRKLKSAPINAVLDAKAEGKTPDEREQSSYRLVETRTTRLLAAMQKELESGQ